MYLYLEDISYVKDAPNRKVKNVWSHLYVESKNVEHLESRMVVSKGLGEQMGKMLVKVCKFWLLTIVNKLFCNIGNCHESRIEVCSYFSKIKK